MTLSELTKFSISQCHILQSFTIYLFVDLNFTAYMSAVLNLKQAVVVPEQYRTVDRE